MNETVPLQAAESQLASLVARVEAGEEIIIAREGTPVVKLVAVKPPAALRQPGRLKGVVSIGDEALDDWTEDEQREWDDGHPGDPLRQT